MNSKGRTIKIQVVNCQGKKRLLKKEGFLGIKTMNNKFMYIPKLTFPFSRKKLLV